MCNLHLQGTGFLPKGPAFSWNGSGFQVSGGTSELLAAEAFSREEEARGGLGNTCGLCPAAGKAARSARAPHVQGSSVPWRGTSSGLPQTPRPPAGCTLSCRGWTHPSAPRDALWCWRGPALKIASASVLTEKEGEI